MRNRITVGPDAVPTEEDRFVSLRAPLALAALYRLTGSHDLVHVLASRYGSWDRLASASAQELAPVLGQRAATFTLPDTPPATPDSLPDDTELITRYSLTYPAELRESASPPVVLYVRGQLPEGPMIGIGGGAHPSPQGVEIARSAGLAAVAQMLPVVVMLGDGVGVTALRSVTAAGGKAIVVVPHGLDQTSKFDVLLGDVLELGGAIVSEVPPGVSVTEFYTAGAARIVAGMSDAVVLAEVGRHLSAGAAIAAAAIAASRYLVVPSPQQHYVPESALGLVVLTQTRAFSDAWYGTNSRITARTEDGLSPADYVVNNQADIAQAIAYACNHRR